MSTVYGSTGSAKNIRATVSSGGSKLSGSATQVSNYGFGSHATLLNRDAADQHPIDSITGLRAVLDTKFDDIEVVDGYIYLLCDGERISGPHGPFAGNGTGGGGGGGGAVLEYTVKIENLMESRILTFPQGVQILLKFRYTSLDADGLDDGPGVCKLYLGNSLKSTFSIEQGDREIDVTDLLAVGSNTVKFTIENSEGSSKSLSYTVTVAAVSMESTFDTAAPYPGDIPFPYTPTGLGDKIVHFELDGDELPTETVTTSGRQQTYVIPAQPHGAHSLRTWFETTVEGVDLTSNELYYEFMSRVEGNGDPIISSSFRQTEIEQYDTVTIKWKVYHPLSLATNVVLKANGNVVQNLTAVDRTEQTWSYRADVEGSLELTIECGDIKRPFNLTVSESKISVEAETNDLSLYLSSYGRNNSEENPAVWEYGSVQAVFEDFNFVSDGWIPDDEGITALRVGGDAKLTIPFKLFGSDPRTTGRTIEIEFATRAVRNYDAVILTCMSGGRGLEITSQKATMVSEQSTIGTQYKEEEHIRLSFVIEKRSGTSLLMCYLNGILSGVVAYPSNDSFTQASPVDIVIGSTECTMDIYNIRVYENNLTRYQILDNWIADTQSGSLRKDRYDRNNIYDIYGQITIGTLKKDLPYLVIESSVFPQFKGDKKTCSGYYVDPLDPSKSFRFEAAKIDVQGTSSQYYYVKNYKTKYEAGFILPDGSTVEDYQMNSEAVPTATFTYKADVASSEGANNVVLAKLYNALCPVKTPPQVLDSKVRQTIDGHPIVIFWDSGSGPQFIGKYNFNNDKGTEEVFGFKSGDESWEILQNGTDRVGWRSADFSGTDWKNDFEARFPEDNVDTTKLAALSRWLVSTDIDAATGNELTASVNYEGVEYTHDTAEYRLAKFKFELADHCDVDALVFYYMFTELFLCIDQREKNAFPTLFQNMGKWIVLFYDADSSLGIDNKGNLTFDPYLEDIDFTEAGDPVFNGQASVLWANLRNAFYDRIMKMYQDFRIDGLLSYDIVNDAFESHQSMWSEAIYNEDGYRKSLEPYINDNDPMYLPMLQGKKELQRKWWLYNRFRYLDTKYITGTSESNKMIIRAHAKENIKLISYVNMYGHVYYNAEMVEQRMVRGQEYEFVWTATGAEDPVIGINDCDLITSLGDLSPHMVESIDLASASHLTYLKLGDASEDYVNDNLNSITFGNNVLLKQVDCRNCASLSAPVDMSTCTNVEEVYFDGTSVTAVSLPNGGNLKILHLPGTVKNLTVLNQRLISDFSMPSYSQITTLRLENNSSAIDTKAILDSLVVTDEVKPRVRLIGFTWDFDSVDAIRTFYTKLDTFAGLDETDLDTDKPQMQGTLHVGSLTGAELAELQNWYPNITINYDHITSYVYYYTYDGSSLLSQEAVYDGADAVYSGKPTRTSTAQYNFTFAGWSREPNGEAEANAQKAITEDRNLYAAYTATVRTYTVKFYNGTTLLQTVTAVPYGGSATYTGSTPVSPEGSADDYPFLGWSPVPTNIKGATSCYAQFGSPIQVAEITDDWPTIFASLDDGTYKTKYSVGNYKSIDLGSEGIIDMQIAAFDSDLLADGSGKAKISWVARQLLVTPKRMNPGLEIIYKTVEENPAWNLSTSTTTEKKWESTNGGIKNNIAEATWTITAQEAQTLKVYYKVSYASTAYNKLTVVINGETILDEGSVGMNSYPYETIEMAAGDVCTVYAKHTSVSAAQKTNGTIRLVTTGSFETNCTVVADIGTTTSLVIDYYEIGTGAIGGWENCELRDYLRTTIKPLIPAEVASRIVEVTKVQDTRDTDAKLQTQTTVDDVFIPSDEELNDDLYSALYDKIGKKKTKYGSTSNSNWFYRSVGSNTAFYGWSGTYQNNITASSSYCPCLCFCTS